MNTQRIIFYTILSASFISFLVALARAEHEDKEQILGSKILFGVSFLLVLGAVSYASSKKSSLTKQDYTNLVIVFLAVVLTGVVSIKEFKILPASLGFLIASLSATQVWET